MTNEDEALVTEEFRTQLRDAVEESAARDLDWTAFHARLNETAGSVLGALRRRASSGYRLTAAAGAAWWDYAAGFALAAVPLGLAAALLLVTYLRADSPPAGDAPLGAVAMAAAPENSDSARAAFESVLTGTAAPQAVIATLIPVPAAAFLAESVARSAK